MALWHWHELEEALAPLGVQGVGADVAEPSGVAIDSRTLQPGDLFVALSGDPGPGFHAVAENPRDGHDFIQQAIDAGASAVLVHRPLGSNIPTIQVEDTLDALWALGRFARRRCEGRVVAITGSSGKTTARCYLEALLRDAGRVHASEGSLNNHWGVPLSLARMERESEFAIFEVGMNHPGEIAPLAKLVAPEVALVLNVAPAHLGQFENLDAIRREKLSIADGLTKGGTLVVPSELELGEIRCERVIRFGNADEEVACRRVVRSGEEWLIEGRAGDSSFEMRVPGGGAHRVATATASIAVTYALGCDVTSLRDALLRASVPEGRGNRHAAGGVVVVDDSYNANPASMGHALDLLGRAPARRRIAILGEMLELGASAESLHRELAGHCRGIDRFILVGPSMAALYNELPESQRWRYCDSVDELSIADIAAGLQEGDEVLVKGSNRIFWVRHFVRDLLAALAAES